MTTPKWQSGHLYLPGDLVQPQQAQPAAQSALTNPGFESGDTTGWTITQSGGTGTPSVATDKKFAGTYAGRWQGAAGTGHSGGVEAVWENATDAPVTPGQSIAASVMFKLDDTDSSQNQAQARLHWYDASSALISTSVGTLIRGNNGSWRQSVVSGSAPAGAATVRLAAWTTANASGGVRLDSATWNHVAPPTTAGLIYKAVQPDPGTSAETEPDWPTTLGVQVIDNTVTWEAVTTSRVVWEASPILTSGATEPDWPTTPGDFVSDGTIKWECVSRRVEDENCPNSKVVAILASKVFAADGDIVRFSATANPLDWTSEQDAGYLPTGLQQANANDMAVLNQYRSNLVAFNASSFQNWQADPDPAAMAILDQMDGIGSTWPRAAQAVSNELLFLSQLGVRSVSIAAGAENLAAGDIGSPIDELVRAAIAVDDVVPIATYYPGAGQYWLAFSKPPVPPPPPPPVEVIWTQGFGVVQKYDPATGATSAEYTMYQPTFLEIFTHAATGRVLMVDSGGVGIYAAGEPADPVTEPTYIAVQWIGGASYTGTQGQGSIDPVAGDAFFCRGSNNTVLHIKPDNTTADYAVQRPSKVCATGNGRFAVFDEWNGAVSLFGPDNSYASPYATVPDMWSCSTAPVFDSANGRIIFQIDNWGTGKYEIGFVDVATGAYTGLETAGANGDLLAYSSTLDRVVFAPTGSVNYGKPQVYDPSSGLVGALDYTAARPATITTSPTDLAIIGATLAVLQQWSDGVRALHLIDLATGLVTHTKALDGNAVLITANDRDGVFYVGGFGSGQNWIYSVSAEAPYTERTMITGDTDNRIVGWA